VNAAFERTEAAHSTRASCAEIQAAQNIQKKNLEGAENAFVFRTKGEPKQRA